LRDRLRTPRLLVAFGGLQFVLFPIPVIILFWTDQIGLSLTEIMMLQVIFGVAVVSAVASLGALSAFRRAHTGDVMIRGGAY
jgi:hypothetical protein